MRSLKRELYIFVSLVIIIIYLIGLSFFYFASTSKIQSEERQKLKSVAESILLIISEKDQDIVSGLKTKEVAQREVIELITESKLFNLGKYGYPVIIDEGGYLRYHPTLQGKYALDFQDESPSKRYFVREQLKVAEAGGGFTHFYWRIPETNEVDKKIVYAVKDPNWNWVIEATSFQVDYDMDIRSLRNSIALLFVSVVFVLVVINRIFIDRFTNPINVLISSFQSNHRKLTRTEIETNIREYRTLYGYYNEMIDELLTYRESLERERARYEKVIQSSYDAYWEYDGATGELVIDNFSAFFSEREMSYFKFLEKIHQEDLIKNAWLVNLKEVQDCGSRELILRIRDQSMNFRWVQFLIIIHQSEDKDQFSIYGSIKDIHESVIEKSKTEFMAYHDAMTGLYNLEYVVNKLQRQELKRYYFALIGLRKNARMKLVYGANLVQIVLFQIAGLLKKHIGEQWDVCHYDENRFLIVSEHGQVDLVALEAIMEEVEAITYAQVFFPKELVISFYEDDISLANIQATFRKLEIAYGYNDTMLLGSQLNAVDEPLILLYERKKKIEQSLLSALHYGEFTMVYQPIEDQSGKLLCFESLMRWQNPELGHVSPAEFIPIAEEIELIGEVGHYAIKAVCSFVKDLSRHYDYPICVSINASVKELVKSDYVDYLIHMIETYQLQPAQIKIEITETAISEFHKELQSTINHLNASGIQVYMDDFGTGYSSLNHWGSIDVSSLKIDKSFVDEILNSSKMALLTRTIVEVAHKLGMKTVAEGIEDEATFNQLAAWGCDGFQGYHLSRPLEAKAVQVYMMQRGIRRHGDSQN